MKNRPMFLKKTKIIFLAAIACLMAVFPAYATHFWSEMPSGQPTVSTYTSGTNHVIKIEGTVRSYGYLDTPMNADYGMAFNDVTPNVNCYDDDNSALYSYYVYCYTDSYSMPHGSYIHPTGTDHSDALIFTSVSSYSTTVNRSFHAAKTNTTISYQVIARNATRYREGDIYTYHALVKSGTWEIVFDATNYQRLLAEMKARGATGLVVFPINETSEEIPYTDGFGHYRVKMVNWGQRSSINPCDHSNKSCEWVAGTETHKYTCNLCGITWTENCTKVNGVCSVCHHAYTSHLTFSANGGDGGQETGDYTIGTTLTFAEPTRKGYTYYGYSTNSSAAYNDSSVKKSITVPSSNANYYAIWKANTYTVSLNKSNGSGGSDSVTATYDSNMPSITLPTRTGYIFKGYYDKQNGAGNKYYSDTGASARTYDKDMNCTLYACWEAASFTLSFDSKGGTPNPSNQSVTYDQAYTAVSIPVKTGYTFKGYYTDPSVETTETKYFDSNGNQTHAKWDRTADTTVYAHWVARTFIVALDKQGGTGGSDSVTVTYDAELPPITVPEKRGYTFNGYYSVTGGSGDTAKYYNADGTSFKIWDIVSDNPKLYAGWTINTYKITFDQNGGCGGTTEVNVTYNEKIPSITLPTREGYEFQGYYSGDTCYIDKTGTSLFNYTEVSDKTLTAKWIAFVYITYDGNGNTSGSMAKQTVLVGEITLSVNAYLKTGYEFLGWSKSKTAETPEYTNGQTVTGLSDGGNVTLYAVWKAIDYKIIYILNGGHFYPGFEPISTIQYIDTVILPNENETVRSDFVLEGWYLEPEFETRVTKLSKIHEDVIVYANWLPVSGMTGTARWSYDSDAETLKISGTNGVTANYTRENAPFFRYKEHITKIVIEEGVAGIGANVFINLTKVNTIENRSADIQFIDATAFKNVAAECATDLMVTTKVNNAMTAAAEAMKTTLPKNRNLVLRYTDTGGFVSLISTYGGSAPGAH